MQNESGEWKIKAKPDQAEGIKGFMDGEGPNAKHVAIISACASTGIDLHSDRRVKNQKKRNHYTLEYGWGPEGFLQQLGRSHRSNQVHPPAYYILQSQVAGEERYVTVISKRLKQLVSEVSIGYAVHQWLILTKFFKK